MDDELLNESAETEQEPSRVTVEPLKHTDGSSEVGYKKPPKATQFRRGVSGNPKGRPKGSKNLMNIIRRDGRQRVQVSGPNGSRFMTKQEAVALQLGNKAAKGELAAMRLYLNMIQVAESVEQATGERTPERHEMDQAVMKNILERFKRNVSGPVSKEAATDQLEPQ